ncbi:hypothetical protein CPAR01_11637 [Colletotrichum paranaense]|uniref:Uncharacterized protein n=1 Tax=Colletotrichum paranaense TaxID=1914294 RepID=A0ABQ9SCV9_9PEZI|nr:uncharacterized protein CPAR01_11637 [Colletotrichum paranaense]KAK1531988.1 hypothetical protein CPAR01_11637 [Colletotrichum paranaense]
MQGNTKSLWIFTAISTSSLALPLSGDNDLKNQQTPTKRNVHRDCLDSTSATDAVVSGSDRHIRTHPSLQASPLRDNIYDILQEPKAKAQQTTSFPRQPDYPAETTEAPRREPRSLRSCPGPLLKPSSPDSELRFPNPPVTLRPDSPW